ncbi:MAG: hypothetical protein AB8G86_17095 [Saprospiraceae bacterium]
MKKITFLFFLLLATNFSKAQPEQAKISLAIQSIDSPIKIDGKLAENVWKQTASATN